MRLYDEGAANGGFEEGIEYALAGMLAHPKFLYRFEPTPEDAAPGDSYALSERRARVAALVLLLELDSRRRAARARGGRRARRIPHVLEQQVERMLADPRAETLASNFAFQWLELGEARRSWRRTRSCSATSTATSARTSSKSRGCSSTASSARIASVLDLLTAESHVRQRSASRATTASTTCAASASAASSSTTRTAGGLLGKGGVLLASSYPNRTSPVLRGAVGAREHHRHAAGRAAAGRRGARRERRRARTRRRCASGSRRTARTRPATAATASSIRSASRSRTSTPSAAGATKDREAGDADRLVGRAGRRHAGQRARRAARGAARAPRAVRADVHREAHDLRARPVARVHRHADGAAHRARAPRRTTIGFRPSCWGIVTSAQFRMKGAPPTRSGARTARMFDQQEEISHVLTKKHLPRRTFFAGSARRSRCRCSMR